MCRKFRFSESARCFVGTMKELKFFYFHWREFGGKIIRCDGPRHGLVSASWLIDDRIEICSAFELKSSWKLGFKSGKRQ